MLSQQMGMTLIRLGWWYQVTISATETCLNIEYEMNAACMYHVANIVFRHHNKMAMMQLL